MAKKKKSKDPRDPANAIRLGADTHIFSDLYYAVLEASWLKLGVLLVIAYISVNLLFAALYASCGDCIMAVDPGSFSGAFFFSVQTISTIGYGHLYPTTDFAEAVVAVESLCGLIGFALVTGLVFSKFSLPSARVVFSDPLLITTYDGKPTLMFRLANARGNDIVEASLKVVVLKPEVSAEGHTMNRLHDLKLSRSTSPLFVMSWLAFHVIDEDSPLHSMNRADIEENTRMFICSMTGLDGTFNTMVHARHIYRHEHLVFNHLYDDVISTNERGNLVLDLLQIHKTHAIETNFDAGFDAKPPEFVASSPEADDDASRP